MTDDAARCGICNADWHTEDQHLAILDAEVADGGPRPTMTDDTASAQPISVRQALREAIDYARLSPNGERRQRWEAALDATPDEPVADPREDRIEHELQAVRGTHLAEAQCPFCLFDALDPEARADLFAARLREDVPGDQR